MLSSTPAIRLSSLDSSHRSESSNPSLSSPRSISARSWPSRFMSTNREAFHSLLAKLPDASTLSILNLISLPGALPVARVNLRASALYSSIISSGSMPLPRDLLIFLPSASRTRPWIKTSEKGFSFIWSRADTIMRATQKNIIS